MRHGNLLLGNRCGHSYSQKRDGKATKELHLTMGRVCPAVSLPYGMFVPLRSMPSHCSSSSSFGPIISLS